MHCGKIHPHYEFQPGQICTVLWCENCGTQMHEPSKGDNAVNTDYLINKISEGEISVAKAISLQSHTVATAVNPLYETVEVLKKISKYNGDFANVIDNQKAASIAEGIETIIEEIINISKKIEAMKGAG